MAQQQTCTSAMYEGIAKYEDEYQLPALPYPYDGLEPAMDEATVKVHHTGHHKAYTGKLNAALKEWRASGEGKDLAQKSILEIIRRVGEVPEKFRKAIKNNGGGYVNHDLFFALMSGKGGGQPSGKIAEHITRDFGSYDAFKAKFSTEAGCVFGSGYAWLSRDQSGKLVITTSVNQESAISAGLKPILVIDVWEHAYYLKHQNRRPEFVKAWWEIVDWSAVEKLDQWWEGK